MPFTFSWPLSVPGLPAPGAIPSTSYLAPGGGVAGCNPYYLTEADLLSVLDRVFPEWYLDPLKADPESGYEVFQAYAKALERVSLAIGRFECSSFILLSHGGFHSVATVEFSRASAAAGAFTLQEGTICRTSRTGRSYYLVADVEFGALDLFKEGQVRAVAPGPEYDVAGPFSTADGAVLPGEIDRVVIPLEDPPFTEPTIQVRQVADAAGGQAAVLDQLGLDRRLPRLPSEVDETYKTRIRQLPDTVSLDAIRRQLDAIFLPRGFQYDLIETWESRYQTCWNHSGGGPTNAIFGPAAQWAYNDPRDDRFTPRWMSEADHRGAFVVIVPAVFPSFADRGMAYNDPATEGSVERAVSAWSSPVLDGATLSGVWNGEDDDSSEGRAAFLRKVWDLLRSVKGGGVAVSIIPAEVDEFET